jgi:hypothetical protein
LIGKTLKEKVLNIKRFGEYVREVADRMIQGKHYNPLAKNSWLSKFLIRSDSCFFNFSIGNNQGSRKIEA